jgi:FixJ family two-component response regulator
MSLPTPSASLCVLVVDDDEGVRRSLQLMLKWRGFAVQPCDSVAAVRALRAAEACGLLVTDYHLPDGTGFDVLAALRSKGWDGRAVLITASANPELMNQAPALGFHAVLEKPMEREALIRALTE